MPYFNASSRCKAYCSVFCLLILLYNFLTSLSASKPKKLSKNSLVLTDQFWRLLLSHCCCTCWRRSVVYVVCLSHFLYLLANSWLQSLHSCQELLVDLDQLLYCLIIITAVGLSLFYHLLQFFFKFSQVLFRFLCTEVNHFSSSFGGRSSGSVL